MKALAVATVASFLLLLGCTDQGAEGTEPTPGLRRLILAETAADAPGTERVLARDPVVEAILQRAVDQFAPSGSNAVAAVTVDGATGLIVGAASSTGDPYDFLDQQHPSASTLKAIVAASAVAAGAIPTDLVAAGVNCSFPGGIERRIDPSDDPLITLSRAAEVSSDCGFVKLSRIVGPDAIAETLRLLGVERQLDVGDMFAVGANTVSLRELAQVATSLLRGDARPISVTATAADGAAENPPTGDETLSDIGTSTIDILRGVLVDGTAAGSELVGHEAFGKTGTTGPSTHVWFVGGSANYVTAVWAGTTSSSSGGLTGRVPIDVTTVTGGNYAARVWQAAMTEMHEGLAPSTLPTSASTRDPVILVDPEVDCVSSQSVLRPSRTDTVRVLHLELEASGLSCASA